MSNCPDWHQRIHLFDGLEISPCIVVGESSFGPVIEVTDDPDSAQFWSVYGHYNPARCNGFGGVDCLEDFPTEAEAHAFADRLRRTYPHLAEELAT